MKSAYLEVEKRQGKEERNPRNRPTFFQLKCGIKTLVFEVFVRSKNPIAPFITLTVFSQARPHIQYRDHFSLMDRLRQYEWTITAARILRLDLEDLKNALTPLRKQLEARTFIR